MNQNGDPVEDSIQVCFLCLSVSFDDITSPDRSAKGWLPTGACHPTPCRQGATRSKRYRYDVYVDQSLGNGLHHSSQDL